MSPSKPKATPVKVVDARTIREELGVSAQVARGIFRAVAREYGPVTFPGYRRIFVRREDFDRYLASAGAMRWL